MTKEIKLVHFCKDGHICPYEKFLCSGGCYYNTECYEFLAEYDSETGEYYPSVEVDNSAK